MAIREKILDNYKWLNGYKTSDLTGDLISALVLAILLIPQSLAYALLAGLPPQVGIYAAIAPAIVYAFFGSSRVLSVGPVAMTSILTVGAIAQFPEEMRVVSAAILALMSGVMLLTLGLFRGGSLSTFFSRPVVSAYITGAAILIIVSQLKHIFQIDVSGRVIADMIPSFLQSLNNALPIAILFGVGTVIALWFVNTVVYNGLRRMHVRKKKAKYIGNISPFIIVVSATALTALLSLDQKFGLATVGEIPAKLPRIAFPVSDLEHWKSLVLAAIIIALVGFVDSVSVGQTLAAKKRQRVDPNKELIGTGVANIAGGLTGAYPVAGSLSRSALNHATGARSPLVGLFGSILMAIAVLTVMPLLKNLPLAVLAGLIVYSCFSLLNFKEIWRTWCYSKADAFTAIGAFSAVLLLGVQYGVLVGTILSMLFHIRLTLKPHTVEVGRFLGTEHYRDSSRYEVEEFKEVKTLRIDESLYFANARFLEDTVSKMVVKYPKMTDLVLMCPAVNRIDASALESLMEINERLDRIDVSLHFSEIHSHVMDRLHRSNFLDKLSGRVFMSQHEAIEALRPEPDWSQFSDHVDIH